MVGDTSTAATPALVSLLSILREVTALPHGPDRRALLLQRLDTPEGKAAAGAYADITGEGQTRH